MKVIKRNGSQVGYEGSKIIAAINKAMTYGSGNERPDISIQIESDVFDIISSSGLLTIEQIESIVFNKLIEYGEEDTARAYEGYRAIQEYKRQTNTTDKSIMGLLEFTNEEVMRENSNKDATLVSTQRDLIAGEVSKDIARRKLIPAHLIQAHDRGLIHIHK